MTYFQNDNGDVLEMVDEFSLKRSCANLFNFEIKGDYSISFQMHNTSDVRKKLGYYSNVQTPNPAFLSPTWNLVKNGNIIGSGKMVIERDDYQSIYLFFASGNSNWINLITGGIKDLDYEDYAYLWDSTFVSSTDVLLGLKGFVFPMVEWSAQWNRGNYGAWFNQIIDSKADYLNTTFSDFYPCFFLNKAMEQIFKAFNIKLAGDLLTDPLYKSLILTPDSGQISRAPLFLNARHAQAALSANSAFNTVYSKIAFDTINFDGTLLSYDTTNKRYNVHKTFCLQIDISLVLSAAFTFTVAVYKNGAISTSTYVTPTASTIVQPGALYLYVQDGDYIEIFGKCSAGSGNVTTFSTVEYQPRPIVVGGQASGAGSFDTIRASDILPNISAIDFVKFVINYFCCIPTFDQSTTTVTLNKLDNYKIEDAVDWSEFLQAYENNYSVKTAKNNYIRVTQPDDPQLNSYNGGKTRESDTFLNYGEALLKGQSEAKVNNNLMTIPFGPAVDKISVNNSMMLSSVPLVDLQDDGQPIAYSSVNNLAPGAQFVASNFPKMVTGQIIRFFGAGPYNGYTTVSASTATDFTCWIPGNLMPFIINNSGFFTLVKFSYKRAQSRMLYFVPNVYIGTISNNSITTFKVFTDIASSSGAVDHMGWAYYSKPSAASYYPNPINSYNVGVNPGALTISRYDRPTQGTYFKYVSRILNSPYVKVQLYLPEYDYAAFQFGTFIALIDGDNRKYYLVDSIENYKDASTMCQANLLLIQ